MKWGFLNLAILAALLAPANLLATEEWEQKLKEEGWVKVEKNLQELANTTWYGLKSKYSDKRGIIHYIHSDGINISEKIKDSKILDHGIRKISRGQICIKWDSYFRQICRSTWKKERVYMLIPPYGLEGSLFYGGTTTWMVKKGDIENLK